MYLVGVAHEHKSESQAILRSLIAAQYRLVCDAEVLQEILHRYTAIGRREAIQPALNVLLGLVDDVIPIERQDVLRAAAIVSGKTKPGARDALHLAVMERYGIRSIFSFDRDFDRWPGIERICGQRPMPGL